MKIEEFFTKSEGEWISMRSSHSLAFKQFENVISQIKISSINPDDSKVLDLVNSYHKKNERHVSPLLIEWESDSDWQEEESANPSSGKSIIIPIPKTNNSGLLIKSVGYIEQIQTLAKYHFLPNDTLIIISTYESTVSEEHIHFISSNVRYRYSVIKSEGTNAVLNTSFASEIRKLNI